MNIKDLKQTLAKTIQDVENVYHTYTSQVGVLNESIKKNEMKQMQMMRDDEKLAILLNKYQEIDSLASVKNDARLTVKAAEEAMSAVAKERAEFEKYRSEESAKLNTQKLLIDEDENKMLQREVNLQNAIDAFNELKEMYHYKTEGEAHF